MPEKSVELPHYCKLLEKIGRLECGLLYGVLDTPCYPCRYYGGPIEKSQSGKNDEWITLNNATSNFFRDQGEAYLVATQRFERLKEDER